MQNNTSTQRPLPESSIPSRYRVAIIGAGASGMVAAIEASRARPHTVLLLEKEARVGRKLFASGNGRCNLLNMNIDPYHGSPYYGSGGAAALALVESMPPSRLVSYFSSLGLLIREESEGRCYPKSGQAASVLDVLRFTLHKQCVDVQQNATVQTISRDQNGFSLRLASGREYLAKRVVFAAGGKAAPSFGADGSAFQMIRALGHSLVPLRPALAPLKVPADRIRGLKGIRVQAQLELTGNGRAARKETGEVLFTEYGLSGIAAMQLSRCAGDEIAKKNSVAVCLRMLDRETAFSEAQRRLSLFAEETMESVLTGLLPKRVSLCLLREAGISPGDTVTETAVRSVLALSSGWTLPVIGVMPFQNAQITAGGLAFEEFDAQTLESKLIPGLYACGEALDVDGDCGGYNLMWAWVSGITAGRSASAL